MAARKEPPPFGLCSSCGIFSRLWQYHEAVIDFGIGIGAIVADGLCRMCIRAHLEAVEILGTDPEEG